jgi:hypothetical protein
VYLVGATGLFAADPRAEAFLDGFRLTADADVLADRLGPPLAAGDSSAVASLAGGRDANDGGSDAAAWVTVRDTVGRYEAAFPETPADTVQISSSLAGPLDVHMKLYERTSLSLLAAYTDFPPEVQRSLTPADQLDNLVDTITAGSDTASVERRDFEVEGYPGTEVRFVRGPLLYRWRYLLVGQRAYQQGAITLVAAPREEDGTRFLESFRLTEPADSIAANLRDRPRIERLLDRIGYTYERDADGDYSFVLSFDDGRSQLVYVTPSYVAVDERSRFDVWSLIYRAPEPPSADVLLSLMQQNGTAGLGAFQAFETESGHALVFSAYAEADLEAAALQRLIEHVVVTADRAEEAFVGGDAF